MRSFIFCTCYTPRISEGIKLGRRNTWLERIEHYRATVRWRTWLKYYSERQELFGAERIFLIDDGTPIEDIKLDVIIINADELPDTLPPGKVLFRFTEHLGRRSLREFPGWWRSFTFASRIQEKYSFDKIIHIESDAFVLSPRMAEYIKRLATGWTAFFCPSYKLPETAIQIICKDSLQELRKFWEYGNEFWQRSLLAERTLPFTEIKKDFIGDRYGERYEEYRRRARAEQIDYVCQAHSTMIFSNKLKPPSLNPIHSLVREVNTAILGFVLRMFWKVTRYCFKARATEGDSSPPRGISA